MALSARQRPAHHHAAVNPSELCLLQMWQRGSVSESSPAEFLQLSEHHQPKPTWKCCEAAAELILQSAQPSCLLPCTRRAALRSLSPSRTSHASPPLATAIVFIHSACLTGNQSSRYFSGALMELRYSIPPHFSQGRTQQPGE